MAHPILDADHVTPAWLTAVLRREGVLARAKVTHVAPGKAQSTFASRVWHLRVQYSESATPRAPRRLFLKVSRPELAPGEYNAEHLEKEIRFYEAIAPAMGATFTIPCYDAAYGPGSGASHVLLCDVSETHRACRVPPCAADCERAVDALARLHAFWWDHPRLGRDVGRFPTQVEREREWQEARVSTLAFMDALGDRLQPAWRAVYERVLPSLPRLYERHAQRRNLTLVHGDAHLGNFLFPSGTDAASTYIVDWQFWHASVGGTDLAFMMATQWDPALRRRLEGALVRRYHRSLAERGIVGYGWDDCWDDYRLSVILVSIFIPVWRWSVFKWDADIATLARSMTAFDDLGCGDLL